MKRASREQTENSLFRIIGQRPKKTFDIGTDETTMRYIRPWNP
jgi:hypothetical protein